jgi:hypothetical protein
MHKSNAFGKDEQLKTGFIMDGVIIAYLVERPY